jgi:hypothetical protein
LNKSQSPFAGQLDLHAPQHTIGTVQSIVRTQLNRSTALNLRKHQKRQRLHVVDAAALSPHQQDGDDAIKYQPKPN